MFSSDIAIGVLTDHWEQESKRVREWESERLTESAMRQRRSCSCSCRHSKSEILFRAFFSYTLLLCYLVVFVRARNKHYFPLDSCDMSNGVTTTSTTTTATKSTQTKWVSEWASELVRSVIELRAIFELKEKRPLLLRQFIHSNSFIHLLVDWSNYFDLKSFLFFIHSFIHSLVCSFVSRE